MIEKTWLLQESITHPTKSFEVFVNKKPTFNCSINDAGTTIFLRCCTHKKKQQILYSLSSSKTSFWELRTPFLRKKWLTTNNNNQIDWERCWEKNKKQQMLCPLSSSKSLLLRASGSISEKIIDWEQTIMIKLIVKDGERKAKNSKYCAHCLRAKVCFWKPRPSFLRN